MMTPHLSAALWGGGRTLRITASLARLLPALATALAALAAAAWLARLGGGGIPVAVVAAWTMVVLSLVTGLWLARRIAARWSAAGVASRLEQVGQSRRGALTALLEAPVAGTSSALHHAALDAAAGRVATDASASLAADVVLWRSRALRGGIAIMVAGAALVAARPLDGSTAMVWRPWQAWSALTSPVLLSTSTPVVGRGESATLHLRAWGQRNAVLRTRAPGEPWQELEVALDAEGQATITTDPLDATLVATLVAAGRVSAEVQVTVRLPAFLGAFSVTAEYPGYLNLERELLMLDEDTLVVPAGTVLVVEGRATAPLATALLEGPAAEALTVDGGAFRGRVVPRADGTWRLQLATADGSTLEGPPPTFTVRVVADAPPSVAIPVPGRDTIAPPSLAVPVVIAIEDDHGLRSAGLELQVRNRSNRSRQALELPAGTADRALITTRLDLAALGLGPGDTLWYTAVAGDNAPGQGVGRSPTYAIRVPTEAEQRQARQAATTAAAEGFDSLAVRAREAQRQSEDLARERPQTDRQREGGSGSDPLSAEGARRAEAAVEAQEAIQRDAEQLRSEVEELRQAAAQEGTADSALAQQLAEIRDLLDRAMSPELEAQLEALREAVRDLDARRSQDALRDLAAEQAKMRQALEQARELFERAALEAELTALADAAAELAEAQQEAIEKLASDPAQGAKDEEALARKADALADALEQSAPKMEMAATKEGMSEAAQQAREAAGEMRQASEAAQQGKPQQAKASAEAAGEMLDAVEEKLRQERDEMQAAMRAEVSAALDRLLVETTRLLDRQLVVADAYRRGAIAGPVRIEQGLLEEGVARLFQQVLAAAGKNALVSPRIATAMLTARTSMRAAIDVTATSAPNLGAAAEQAGSAVDALTVAAHALLRSKEQVDGSASGSGMQEAMEQMQQMAQAQGQVTRQGQGMMQDGEGGLQQMLQLAMQQRAIAQQLELMQAAGQMPGAGELAREAKEISRTLEAGRLTPETARRQEQLFRRMLDAGRSLEGDERDETKERQSEVAGEVERRLPPSLDPRLRRNAGDVPLPGWDELQQLRPEDRRRVLEYFRRLAVGGG
ncbi:MAG: hypothetical protein SFU57_04580 [Gemmatimonadales bacterium]|nr:hypothetical protein [Gemmatimonadales bacterium]